MANNQDLESGARQVEASEHMNSGLTETRNLSGDGDDIENGPAATHLGELTVSMFQQGSSVHVRAGNPAALAEVYEGIFEDVNEANTALIEEGVLSAEQVPNRDQLLAHGTVVRNVTSEQLLRAGMKQKNQLGSY